MSSPFPGMDLYIEAGRLWGDFHHTLISEIKNALSDRLPERYVVRAAERSYVELMQADDEEACQMLEPDVAVTSNRGPGRSGRKSKGSSAAAPGQSEIGAVMMRALVKAEFREPYLEIHQVDPDRKLVTGIEVLSPTNKRYGTKGWRLYSRKRLAYLSGRANFVEIDQLRRGRRMPMISRWPESPYYLLVCRKKKAPRCAVWPAHFNEPLPTIPIPLLAPDADLSLDLQPLVEAIYTRSRYQREIDYRRPLEPALSAAEQSWLEERMRES